MKYLLRLHKDDDAMVEATYTWTNSKNEEKKILAFVVHVDCVEDEDIKHELSIDGMCEVEMKPI